MNTKSTMLFALLLGLSLQTQAQDARLHALRPEATATPEELQAMQPHKAAETKAISGGLECKDAFIEVNIALSQRITRNVFCPAGTVAVSGGATATVNTGLYINATGPTSGTDIDPNKWFTSVENFSSPAGGIGPSVRFYARCCRALP